MHYIQLGLLKRRSGIYAQVISPYVRILPRSAEDEWLKEILQRLTKEFRVLFLLRSWCEQICSFYISFQQPDETRY